MLSFLRAAAAAALLASAAGAAAAGAAADPSPPLLGPVVTAPFNQTIRVAGFEFDNYVDFFYDATTAPVGSSLSAHHQGQHDELCTSVAGKSLSEEPCTLLDSADSWLYLIFPQSKLCCRACNTTDFCGIIASDWLQENSTYVGTTTIGGVECDGFLKVGGEQNFWFTTVASRNDKFARQPCRYDEGYPTFAQGSNFCEASVAGAKRTRALCPSQAKCARACAPRAHRPNRVSLPVVRELYVLGLVDEAHPGLHLRRAERHGLRDAVQVGLAAHARGVRRAARGALRRGLEDAAQAVRELLHSSSDPPCAASPRLHGHDVGPALDRAVGPHAGTDLVIGHAELARHAVLAAALGRRRG